MFNLFDKYGDGFDGTRLEVRDSATGEVIGYVGGAFTGGDKFSKQRCNPTGGCVLAQVVGGGYPLEHSWNAQSLDELTTYA